MTKLRTTSKRVASKAGALMGLTRQEFRMDFARAFHAHFPCAEKLSPGERWARDWCWRLLSRRARSVAGSAMSQRSGK